MRRRTRELVEVPQEDGTIKEFFRRRRLWVRLDYLLSAWAQTPEDEQLLLGLIIRTVMENPEIPRDKLKGQSFEDDFRLNVLMSARLDEGTLARFWGSLNQPVRPAVQAWTAIPILPEKLEEFKRVQTRQLEYKSITDPRIRSSGPERQPVPRLRAGSTSEAAARNSFDARAHHAHADYIRVRRAKTTVIGNHKENKRHGNQLPVTWRIRRRSRSRLQAHRGRRYQHRRFPR